MPWCEHCAKFWTPSSMNAGRLLPHLRPGAARAPRQRHRRRRREDVNVRELAGDDAKAPWHFKVLMALVALYLGWRLVQLVALAF